MLPVEAHPPQHSIYAVCKAPAGSVVQWRAPHRVLHSSSTSSRQYIGSAVTHVAAQLTHLTLYVLSPRTCGTQLPDPTAACGCLHRHDWPAPALFGATVVAYTGKAGSVCSAAAAAWREVHMHTTQCSSSVSATGAGAGPCRHATRPVTCQHATQTYCQAKGRTHAGLLLC